MRTWLRGMVGLLFVISLAPAAFAADAEVSLTALPLRYAFVSGDAGKFSAHHWMPAGYLGGVKDFSGHVTLSNGVEVSGDGHAIIDANDIGTELAIKKDGVGFFNLDYAAFRKYYDNTGGTYYRFGTLSGVDTFKDLHLDLGTFKVESGVTLEGLPEVTFLYSHDTKQGAKSRLTWVPLVEGSTTKNIGPAWQDIDEREDSFAIRANHELAGYSLKGEQYWEFVRTETLREEDFLSTNADSGSTASQHKIRRQEQAPEANLATSTVSVEREWLEGKVFTSGAYHFAHMRNREFESLNEFNSSGVLTNFSNPKQIIDARADNKYNTHTWVNSVLMSPWHWLSFTTKLKSEVVRRESNSSYPADASPNSTNGSTPNGTIDSLVASLNKNKAVRWGEGMSLRFTAIPRTALYTELDLEQARVILAEDRKDLVTIPNVNEDFSRYTITSVRRGVWTLGGHVAPWSFFDLTIQARRRVNNNDYDDQRETVASGTALSAFFDMQNLHTDEVMTRATLRPCRWFRTSFRYQLRADKYATRVENEPIVKTGALSNIYTFDVSLQPLRDLTTTASFSRQTAVTKTPSQFGSTAAINIPSYHADVNTWLFSADYAPTQKVSLNGNLLISSAGNFNDFSAAGIPYGKDFNRVDLTTGLKWSVTENTSVDTSYGFYSYLPNSLAEVGGYHAHVIWLEGSVKF